MSAPLTPDATDATVWSGLRIALHRGLGHAVNIRLSSREQEDRMRRAWVELDKLRERLERAEQSERDLSDVMGLLQRRLQPDGSPPAGTVVTLADWITQSALLRIAENEKDTPDSGTVRQLEASAADWEREIATLYPTITKQAADRFARWFCENYPDPTVISDPAWHAGKIYRAALGAIQQEAAARGPQPSRSIALIAELRRLVDMYDKLTICEDAHGVGIYHGEDRIAYGADAATALADSLDQWELARAIIGRNRDAL